MLTGKNKRRKHGKHDVNVQEHDAEQYVPRERFLKRGGIALAFSVEFLQNPFLA